MAAELHSRGPFSDGLHLSHMTPTSAIHELFKEVIEVLRSLQYCCKVVEVVI